MCIENMYRKTGQPRNLDLMILPHSTVIHHKHNLCIRSRLQSIRIVNINQKELMAGYYSLNLGFRTKTKH